MKIKPNVYLICGFIGAGKTTFAKKLEEKTGAVKITKDEWSIRLIEKELWEETIISQETLLILAEKC